MNPKLLKILIYTSGIICLAVFMSIRIVPEITMNLLLKIKTYPEYEDSTKYSELYYLSMVDEFKEDMPQAIRKYRFSDKQPELNEAEIIVFGDSHFDHSRQLTLPERIADATGKKVYFHRIAAPYWSSPFSFLEGANFQPGNAKVFIYGTAERYLHERFLKTFHVDFSANENSLVRRIFEDYLFPENTEFLYNTILKKSYLTHELYAAVNTFKFRTFDYIPSQTPKYIVDDDRSFVFYHESVDYYYETYSDSEVSIIAENLERMSREMKRKYGMDFILLPVPEQYTVYNEHPTQQQYNQLLPRLYSRLKDKDVRFIKLYEPFMESQELVYYRTDTHWNEKGVDIAFNLLMQQLNKVYAEKP